ncbi:MAG: hypothetical protein K0U98_18540 [Deltaproteobacteria bacterium]|nr:hypothetical protein [Deltaproteobacteria bacterium]
MTERPNSDQNPSSEPALRGAQAAWNRSLDPARELEEQIPALRRQGMLQGIIGAAIGVLIFLFWHRNMAFVVWTLSSLTVLTAILSPQGLYRRLLKAIEALGHVIGRVLTVVLLVPLYLLFFTPFGGLLRRGRRDRMKRWYEADAQTYWQPRDAPSKGLERYERQF